MRQSCGRAQDAGPSWARPRTLQGKFVAAAGRPRGRGASAKMVVSRERRPGRSVGERSA
jgi:hypothetical protein